MLPYIAPNGLTLGVCSSSALARDMIERTSHHNQFCHLRIFRDEARHCWKASPLINPCSPAVCNSNKANGKRATALATPENTRTRFERRCATYSRMVCRTFLFQVTWMRDAALHSVTKILCNKKQHCAYNSLQSAALNTDHGAMFFCRDSALAPRPLPTSLLGREI